MFHLRKQRNNMVTTDPRLVEFIKEARRRDFDDYHIRQPLLDKGWPIEDVNNAFSIANLERGAVKSAAKSRIEIYLDADVLKNIEKRAKKNILSIPEQIEDIVRRSCVRSKSIKPLPTEKIDDLLVGIFSRRKSGRKH